MLLKPEPLYDCISRKARPIIQKVIFLSPPWKSTHSIKTLELSKEKDLVLLSGHYEGIDQRIIDNYIDEEISIGDYANWWRNFTMVLIDAISRLIDDVLSSNESYVIESHYNGVLEYPQYTRPLSLKVTKFHLYF